MSSNNKQKSQLQIAWIILRERRKLLMSLSLSLSLSHSLSPTLVLPLSGSAAYNWLSRTKQNTKKDNLKQQQRNNNNNNNAWKISKASKKLITNWTEK